MPHDTRISRRTLIRGTTLAGLAWASGALAAPAADEPRATFVLVHGAWHGGWCWRPVADLLRAEGHRVFTPTLTGCGERVHVATPATDLATHVADILATLHYEALTDIVLVGHSYAGFVISQAASEASDKVRRLVYLDAFLPEPDQSFAELTGQDVAQLADGDSVPPMLSVSDLGISDPDLAAFVEERLTGHPVGALQQGAAFDPRVLARIPRSFIHTSDLFAMEAEKAATMGFDLQTLPGAGHDVMLTQPAELAERLLAMAHDPA